MGATSASTVTRLPTKCTRRTQKNSLRVRPPPRKQATALIAFLREEWEIFTWCPADMPGIPREFAEHALHIKPNTKPVKQALRRFSEPKSRAIGEEVNRLLDAQFIQETNKATWSQPSAGTQERHGRATNVCRLRASQQALPKGPLPPA